MLSSKRTIATISLLLVTGSLLVVAESREWWEPWSSDGQWLVGSISTRLQKLLGWSQMAHRMFVRNFIQRPLERVVRWVLKKFKRIS